METGKSNVGRVVEINPRWDGELKNVKGRSYCGISWKYDSSEIQVTSMIDKRLSSSNSEKQFLSPRGGSNPQPDDDR